MQKGLDRKLEHYSHDMDRKLQDKMNIPLTREERVILWNLVCDEYDKIVRENDRFTVYQLDRLKELKVLETLIIG